MVNERMTDQELQGLIADAGMGYYVSASRVLDELQRERRRCEQLKQLAEEAFTGVNYQQAFYGQEISSLRAELLKVTGERDAWEKKFWEARWRVQELPTVNGTYGSVERYAALKAIDSVASEAPEQGEAAIMPAPPRPSGTINVKLEHGEPAKPLADPVDEWPLDIGDEVRRESE